MTSVPNTDGVADIPYEYQVFASDPNGDFLTFELISAPDGMQIDPLRGLITWTPDPDQPFVPIEDPDDPTDDPNIEILGITDVIVQVSDGRGGGIRAITSRVTAQSRAESSEREIDWPGGPSGIELLGSNTSGIDRAGSNFRDRVAGPSEDLRATKWGG